MSGFRFVHDIDDLADDLVQVAAGFRRGAGSVVAEVAREGNQLAKDLARASNPRHARQYAGTFSSARTGLFEAEYGPAHRGQGMLAHILERSEGRALNSAQHNLDRSADVAGPRLARRVGDFAEGLFWPGGDQ